jgi:uncharacterized membrane protein
MTMRRRLDNFSLRMQGRLDSEWSDRVLPWVFFAILFVFFVILALARARSLDGGVDLGVYTQASYLIIEEGDPIVTVTDGTHILAQQAAFIFYPIAWITSLVPIIPTLLIIQSAALAFGAVPLWKIARRLANLRVGASAAVIFAYGVYPAIQNLNLADFHPETIAVPALLFAAYNGLRGRWIFFTLSAFVAVMSRADLALAIAGLGLLFMLEGRRRPGAIIAALGTLYTFVAIIVIQPGYGAGSYAHVDSFSSYGETPMGVVGGIVTNPIGVLGDLTHEANFGVIVFLLAPVFFLPVLAVRYLLPVLPLQVIYLIADVDIEATFGQQTVAATAFVFLATTFALQKIGREGVERVTVDRRVLGALILVSTVFFIRDAASSPYRQPWDWGGRDAADVARLDAVDLVGDSDSVRASPALVPLLAERSQIYLLDTTARPDVRDAVEVPADQRIGADEAARQFVDVVILDEAAAPEWSDNERRVFREGLERQGYERTFVIEGVEVYIHSSPGPS